MAIYRFNAWDESGRETTGRIEAATADEARRRLQDRGLRVREIEPAEPAGGAALPDRAPLPDRSLSREEAEQLAAHIAPLSASNLPIASGLRAAAEEDASEPLAKALEWLAQQVEEGRSIEEALASARGILRRTFSGLIAAAAQSGEFGLAPTELADHQQAVRSLRSGIAGALAYPLLVACLSAVLLLVITGLAGRFEKIFADFGADLPPITMLFLWWRHVGLWILAGLLAALAVLTMFLRWRLGPAAGNACWRLCP